ncbi:MAG TPA: type II toxin-antitoxin system HicA family toxin [Pirellulales bacterium]|nr:type II toxin-antitoxin system HicA family toxin [Pirellulales bacterium]
MKKPIEAVLELASRSVCDPLVGRRYNGIAHVPRKIRALVKDLQDAGFAIVPGGGKGSHRKFMHATYEGAVTLSGRDGDDAKKYQEKQVTRAIEQLER